MKLSVQHKVYCLIFLNIILITCLFLWLSDIRIIRNKLELADADLQPKELTIIDHCDSSVFQFLKDSNNEWNLNIGDVYCHANEHALSKILYIANNILHEKKRNKPISFYDPLYSVDLIDPDGHMTRFDVFENETKVFQNNKVYYSDSTELKKFFLKNSKNFVDEKLWEKDIKTIRFLKIQIENALFTFTKKNNVWYMERPFSRPTNGLNIKKILKLLHDVHCHSLQPDQQIPSSSLKLTVGSGDFQVQLDFFQKNNEFFVDKNGISFKISSEFDDDLRGLFEVLSQLRIFGDIHIDSLEVQSVDDAKTVLFQKLEAIHKWQVSSRNGKFVNFLEIDGDEIYNFKNFLSELSLKNQVRVEIQKEALKYKICIYSSVGALNFQIFDNSGRYFLSHEESGSIFEITEKFIENLRRIVEICEQNDEADSARTSG